MFSEFKNFIKTNWHYLLYFVVIFAIVFPLFLKQGFVFLPDFVLANKIPLDWSNFYILSFLIKVLSYVFSVEFLSKFFIAISLFLAIFGAKNLVSNFLSNKYLVFLVSLFGVINPFVYDRIMYGQVGIIIALGFLYYSTSYLFKAIVNTQLENRINKNLILAGFFSGLSVLFALHFIFFCLVFWVLFFIDSIKKIIKKTEKLNFFLLNTFLALFVGFMILLPTINSLFFSKSNTSTFIDQGITQKDLEVFRTSGKGSLGTFWNVLTTSGCWGKDQNRYIDISGKFLFNFSFILLFSVIVFGAYKAYKYFKERRNLWIWYGLLVVFIVALGLSIGIRMPITKEVTYLLFDYLPFYKGLREAQKWVSVILIIYLVFLSFGIKALYEVKFLRNKVSSVFFGIIFTLVIAGFTPLMLWGFGNQISVAKYPLDWYRADEFIVKDSGCNGNVLFLPWHMYMNFKFVGPIQDEKGIQKVVANPGALFFTCNTIVGTNMEFGGIYDNSAIGVGKEILDWLIQNGKNREILDKNNIKYIVLTKEVDWEKYLFLFGLDYLEMKVDETNLYVLKLK